MKSENETNRGASGAGVAAKPAWRRSAMKALKLAVVLVAAEFAVMCILPLLGLEGVWELLADSLLLALLVLPALYALDVFPGSPVEVEGAHRHTRLERRVVLLLVAYVGMVVIVIAVFGLLASRQAHGSRVINVAGRQRMLSQRMVKAAMFEAMELAHARYTGRQPGPRKDTEQIAVQFEQALQGLIGGDLSMGLPPCASDTACRRLFVVKTAWQTLRDLTRQTGQLSDMSDGVVYYGRLHEAGDRVLAEMEAAVGMLEHHYDRSAKLLSTLLVVSVVTACGIGLALAVTFRQMMNHRKRLDAVLKQSEAKTRAIVDGAADGIITIDETGIIESFNAAAERIFHCTAGDVIGQNVSVLMPAPYRDEHNDHLHRYLVGASKKVIGIRREVVGRRCDGSVFPMDLHVSEVRLGRRLVFTGIVRDITERRRLEREILETSRREQQRIGQDLHDVMGQHLTGIAFLAKALQAKLAEKGAPEAESASRIAGMINEAVGQGRALARGLCPVDLSTDGLMAALREYAANFEKLFGVACRFRCDEPILVHNDSVATHLYRIAQEATTNAVKHGKAGQIEIGMSAADGRSVLTIVDDGIGLSEDDQEGDGMGLRIMRYRAGMIGATLDIHRDSGGQTILSCCFENDTTAKE